MAVGCSKSRLDAAVFSVLIIGRFAKAKSRPSRPLLDFGQPDIAAVDRDHAPFMSVTKIYMAASIGYRRVFVTTGRGRD